jgi:hypothetical protein
MIAAVPVAGVALGAALLTAGALACAAAAVVLGPVTAAGSSRPARWPLRGQLDGRVAVGATVGVVVLLLTRWPLLSLVAALLATFWGRILRDDRADGERRRVEAIAKWLEDLRDTLRGSSMGAEEALERVAARPPEAIHGPLAMYVYRRRQGFRTEDALTDLAEGLAHPISDAAIAAIRLVVSGTAGAGRLHRTVTTLAEAARDEVRARERVDRTRAVYQASMKRLVVIAALLVAYLRFAAGDLLDPYGSVGGQLVLLIPLSLWGGCVLWMRSMCRYEPPQRYRIVGSDG